MKKNKMVKRAILGICVLVSMSIFVACGENSSDNKSDSKEKTTTKTESTAKADESKNETEEEIEGDGSLVPTTVSIDGVDYTLPVKLGTFFDNGFTLSQEDTLFMGVEEYNNDTIDIVKDNSVLSIYVANFLGEAVTKEEALVYGVGANDIGKNSKLKFVLSNGISIKGKGEKVKKVYADAGDKFTIDDSKNDAYNTQYNDDKGTVKCNYMKDTDEITYIDLRVAYVN